MTLSDSEALELYEADMQFRNLQPGTINVRHRYMLKLSREIGFAECTEQNLTKWLSRPSLSAKSRAMYISTFHSFFTWALRGNAGKPIYPSDVVDYDDDGKPVLTPHVPTLNISKPKTHPRSPRPMPSEDIRKALHNASPLLRCWIACGAYQGMRCQEIAFLAVEDLNEATGTLEITHGKGDKQRFVPLHPEVVKALAELPPPAEGRYWPDETAASVSRKGNRFLHANSISSTMHQLRHAFGTKTYQDSGGDLILTQGLLGHSSVATTQTYAASDVSKAAGVVSGLTF
jgi:integrase